MQTIELTQPRVIPIQERGHTYTLTIAPITKKQWLDYFAGVLSTSEQVGSKQIESFDANGAKLALMNKALQGAEGYRVASGGITDAPNWRELIPAAHRLAVCNALMEVAHSEADDEDAILLGAETVKLEALWSAEEGANGVAKVSGLKHTFSTPTVEQQRRYSRDRSRSQVIGGSRNGKTRWLGAQSTLAEIYDELIQSVEGYTVDGKPLEVKSEIVAHMDIYHKVFAAESLFAPVSAVVDEKDSE